MEEVKTVAHWKTNIQGQEVSFWVTRESENTFTSHARIVGTEYYSKKPFDHMPFEYEVRQSLERSPQFRKLAGLEPIS